MAWFKDRISDNPDSNLNFSTHEQAPEFTRYWRFDSPRLRDDIKNPGAFVAKAVRSRFAEEASDFLSLEASQSHLFLATTSQTTFNRVSGFIHRLIQQITKPETSVFISGDVGLLRKDQLLRLLGAYGTVSKLILLSKGKATNALFGNKAIAVFSDEHTLAGMRQISFRFAGFQHVLLLTARQEQKASPAPPGHSLLPPSAVWAARDQAARLSRPAVHPSRQHLFSRPAPATGAAAGTEGAQSATKPAAAGVTADALSADAEAKAGSGDVAVMAEPAAVQSIGSGARHAVAADSLNAGPRALAEADSAAMNAAAANMRTEGAFVVAADPAQAETNQAKAIDPFSMPLLSAQDASSSSSVSSSNSGKTASRDCFLKATRPTSCPLDLSPTQRKKENRKDRVAARAIKAAELGSHQHEAQVHRRVGGHRRSFTRPEPYAQWTEAQKTPYTARRNPEFRSPPK